MSTTVKAYAIYLQNKEIPINYSMKNWFFNLEKMLDSKDKMHLCVREIGDKVMRFFPFHSSNNYQTIVVPFGKIKQKNKPYWFNSTSNTYEEFPMDLFDINSLAYDSILDIMFFTSNREGPTSQNVKDYLNTFIPKNSGVEINIMPLFVNSGIEKIRNAKLVRSITITLDLGQPLNNFYANQITSNQASPLTRALESISTSAKDGESKALKLELGLNHGKKDATLEIESMLHLLEQINIQSDFVKEILVTYKDGVKDKIDTAKIKNSTIEISHKFHIQGSQISPEYLLNNVADAIEAKRLQFSPVIREHFQHRTEFHIENFDIVEVWSPKE